MLELVRGKLASVQTWCALASGGEGVSGSSSATRAPDTAQMVWPLRWVLPAALRKRSLASSDGLGWRDGADVKTAVRG